VGPLNLSAPFFDEPFLGGHRRNITVALLPLAGPWGCVNGERFPIRVFTVHGGLRFPERRRRSQIFRNRLQIRINELSNRQNVCLLYPQIAEADNDAG
jgi:hypothetical protein